jgi:serine/threonine protein phosphatase PrpC
VPLTRARIGSRPRTLRRRRERRLAEALEIPVYVVDTGLRHEVTIVYGCELDGSITPVGARIGWQVANTDLVGPEGIRARCEQYNAALSRLRHLATKVETMLHQGHPLVAGSALAYARHELSQLDQLIATRQAKYMANNIVSLWRLGVETEYYRRADAHLTPIVEPFDRTGNEARPREPQPSSSHTARGWLRSHERERAPRRQRRWWPAIAIAAVCLVLAIWAIARALADDGDAATRAVEAAVAPLHHASPVGFDARRWLGRIWMRIMLTGAAETHQAGRENNEDEFVLEAQLGLYAVLDGMGGHEAGEVAARLAKDTVVAFIRRHANDRRFSRRELLECAIAQAAAEVHSAGQKPGQHRMGTTIVACLIDVTGGALIAHAGDSRAYLWRRGELQPLTKDHTVAQAKFDAGTLKPDAPDARLLRNVLTRNLGELPTTEVEFVELSLHPDDRLLLCSDGLYESVAPEALWRVLGSPATAGEAATTLLELALAAKAGDNVTALVVRVCA